MYRKLTIVVAVLGLLLSCDNPLTNPGTTGPDKPNGSKDVVPMARNISNLLINGEELTQETLESYPSVANLVGNNKAFHAMVNAYLNPAWKEGDPIDYSLPVNETFLLSLPDDMVVDLFSGSTLSRENFDTVIARAKEDGTSLSVKAKAFDNAVESLKTVGSELDKLYNLSLTNSFLKTVVNNNIIQAVPALYDSPVGSFVRSLYTDVMELLGPIGKIGVGLAGVFDFFSGVDNRVTPESEYLLQQIQKQFDLVHQELSVIKGMLNDLDAKLTQLNYNFQNDKYEEIVNNINTTIYTFNEWVDAGVSKEQIIAKAFDFVPIIRAEMGNLIRVGMKKHMFMMEQLEGKSPTDPNFGELYSQYFAKQTYSVTLPVAQYQRMYPGFPTSASWESKIHETSVTVSVDIPSAASYLPIDSKVLRILEQANKFTMMLQTWIAHGNPANHAQLQISQANYVLNNPDWINLRTAFNTNFANYKTNFDGKIQTFMNSLQTRGSQLSALPAPYTTGIAFTSSGKEYSETTLSYSANTLSNTSWNGWTFKRFSGPSSGGSFKIMQYYPTADMQKFENLKTAQLMPSGYSNWNWGSMFAEPKLTQRFLQARVSVDGAQVAAFTYNINDNPAQPASVNNADYRNLVTNFVRQDAISSVLSTYLLPLANFAAQEVLLKTYR